MFAVCVCVCVLVDDFHFSGYIDYRPLIKSLSCKSKSLHNNCCMKWYRANSNSAQPFSWNL